MGLDDVSGRAGLPASTADAPEKLAPGPGLLTASRLRAFRKCARLEAYLYRDGFRPLRLDENLAFGTLWHQGMDAWWGAILNGVPEDALDAALAAVYGKAFDAYAQARVEEMLDAYDRRWLQETCEVYDVTAVEEEFRAALVNPQTLAPSRTWNIGGKVDKCVIRRSDGAPGIVEHKTSSEDVSPGSPYWAKLALDHQVSIYYIGAESLSFRPSFCLYDVASKPGQKPLKATPEASRKYTKDGRLYAGQRDRDETPEEYRLRVREALQESRFVRLEIPRTDADLRDFLEDAWAQGRAMREGELAGRAPRNPEACHAYGECPFWAACSTRTDPADMPDRYVRLEWVHPELTPDGGEGSK